MKHNKHDLKTTWYEDGYKKSKAQQIEMIRRHYVDYSDNDWVLWIVADLFHNYMVKDLTGIIEIKKNDGNLIEVPFMVRTPYPNKGIRQLSMKSGKKRLYGIPLVFKSYESLCEVSDITIQWDIYEQWGLKDNDKPFDLHIKRVIIKYHLYFEKDNQNTDYRFFTVFSKDNTYDVYNDNNDRADKYYEEFDLALNVVGSVICDGDDEWESLISDIYTLKNNSDGEENIELTSAEKKVLDELYKLLPNKEKTNDLLKNVVVKSEIQWDAYCYEKTESLTAAYMADILPEPSFGFLERKLIEASHISK